MSILLYTAESFIRSRYGRNIHSGEKVKHRSRVLRTPDQSNLWLGHFIHSELYEELRAQWLDISACQKGLACTLGKKPSSKWRNLCEQLDDYQEGLLKACVEKDEHGNIIRKAGIMSIVLVGGEVFPNDGIRIEFPPEPHQALDIV